MIGRETLLKQRMDAANTSDEFDYMLLDCPPSLGLLTINALCVADEVIIPMQPHFLPLQGVAKLLETVQLVSKRINPRLKVSGVVLTMFDAQTKLSTEVVAELEKFIAKPQGKNLPWSEAQIFKTRIRRNIKLAESPSFGQTIFAYGPTSNGANDYRAFAAEVMSMRGATLRRSRSNRRLRRRRSKRVLCKRKSLHLRRRPSTKLRTSKPRNLRTHRSTRSAPPKVEIQLNPDELDLSKLAAANVDPIPLPPPPAAETRRLRQSRVAT